MGLSLAFVGLVVLSCKYGIGSVRRTRGTDVTPMFPVGRLFFPLFRFDAVESSRCISGHQHHEADDDAR
jgi:hypothetical protein